MKWIGQHIWSFISRFRNDVYLEDLTESAQDHVVGVDADGKLYKQDVSVGDITGVTAGDALTGGGTSGTVTINHDDTSSQASVDNSGRTYIQDITLDTYGHVTGLTSATETVTDTNTMGSGFTVSATTDSNATTITQGDDLFFTAGTGITCETTADGTVTITNTVSDTNTTYTAGTGLDLGGTEFTVDVSDFMTNGFDNRVVTATGTDAMNAEAGLTWDGDDFIISSATTNRPNVYIKNTANHAKPPILYFTKDKGAAGGTGDSPGQIVFQGDNAAQALRSYVTLSTEVVDATAGDEAAAVMIDVATSNGSTSVARNVITGSGHATANTVNVELGYGATSTTTIAGTLTMGSTAAMTNAGLLSVAAQTNITSLGTLTGLTTSGAIELGHASDTTLARSASGKVTIEGNEIVTAGTVGISSGSQSPVGMMIARRTLTQAECNDLHNTPIEIIPAGGASTIIQLIHTTAWVDRAAAQLNSACDLNMHYADQEPGTYFSSSIGHLRRIMYGETGDRVFSIGHLTSGETGQNLTDDVNKGIEVSFDSACTSNSFTTMDIICTYYVLQKT